MFHYDRLCDIIYLVFIFGIQADIRIGKKHERQRKIMCSSVVEHIYKEKLIAICRGVEREQCMKVAKALYAGGFRLMELTFDQRHPESWNTTADVIATLAQLYKGKMDIGAGTVVTPELADIAAKAGAVFIISPDTNTDVIRRTKSLGLVSIPGAYTPTEILTAYNAGADFVKLFPICEMGANYVKLIRAPISHVPLLAVGSVNAETLKTYLDLGCVGAAIGGCVVSKKWIENGEYDKISEMAAELVKIAGTV